MSCYQYDNENGSIMMLNFVNHCNYKCSLRVIKYRMTIKGSICERYDDESHRHDDEAEKASLSRIPHDYTMIIKGTVAVTAIVKEKLQRNSTGQMSK